ncbi:helix-turn-helix transcriptional regulator [Rhodococcus opacus]|uniref:helix-turn-helix transcriptional regulator n=1 Tax=Rhodococcus opacus TaxID=37919 RepID=UPI00046CEE55|nr:helix-turn-helix transcriptional regulator [Rhodococcus opacus]UDH01722.1 helix-turn-helix domain-containing protein [Rhodococcus opacus PD630]
MSRRILRGFSTEHLVVLRENKGLSRGELARLADVSIGTVQAWETGRATPSVDTLLRVAGVLGVSMEEVVRIDPEVRFLGDLRVLAGMTQPQLATKIAISTTALSNLELGQARLTDEVADRIARALDLPKATVAEAYERVRTRPAGDPA